jgi:hypothetical protein
VTSARVGSEEVAGSGLIVESRNCGLGRRILARRAGASTGDGSGKSTGSGSTGCSLEQTGGPVTAVASACVGSGKVTGRGRRILTRAGASTGSGEGAVSGFVGECGRGRTGGRTLVPGAASGRDGSGSGFVVGSHGSGRGRLLLVVVPSSPDSGGLPGRREMEAPLDEDSIGREGGGGLRRRQPSSFKVLEWGVTQFPSTMSVKISGVSFQGRTSDVFDTDLIGHGRRKTCGRHWGGCSYFECHVALAVALDVAPWHRILVEKQP